MTRVVGKALVAGWLGVSTQLCAATLWNGLQDPSADLSCIFQNCIFAEPQNCTVVIAQAWDLYCDGP